MDSLDNIPKEMLDLKAWGVWHNNTVGYVSENHVSTDISLLVNFSFTQRPLFKYGPDTKEIFRNWTLEQKIDNYGMTFHFGTYDDYLYFGLDLDCCLDKNKNPDKWLYDVLEVFNNSYTEYSRNGVGLHLVAKVKSLEMPEKFPAENIRYIKGPKRGNKVPVQMRYPNFSYLRSRIFMTGEIFENNKDLKLLDSKCFFEMTDLMRDWKNNGLAV